MEWLTHCQRAAVPRQTSKEKKPQICHRFVQTIGRLTWHSLWFNHLVLLNFRQCRSAIPQRSAKPKASIHHKVQYPQRNPQFNVITHIAQKVDKSQFQVTMSRNSEKNKGIFVMSILKVDETKVPLLFLIFYLSVPEN